jgi:aspartyl-tRNA synthetase
MSELRLEMGTRLGLRDKNKYSCLWVVDFPLLEWNENDTNLLKSLQGRWVSRHHPFTSPKLEDIAILKSDPEKVRANAYDMVINGVEVGGGSIRIHDKNLQAQIFETSGFTQEEALNQFGFLLNALLYVTGLEST